jgi:hypothetical protein
MFLIFELWLLQARSAPGSPACRHCNKKQSHETAPSPLPPAVLSKVGLCENVCHVYKKITVA